MAWGSLGGGVVGVGYLKVVLCYRQGAVRPCLVSWACRAPAAHLPETNHAARVCRPCVQSLIVESLDLMVTDRFGPTVGWKKFRTLSANFWGYPSGLTIKFTALVSRGSLWRPSVLRSRGWV
jgi:hypothetical protein